MGSETAREQVIDRVLLERHRWTAIRENKAEQRLSVWRLAAGSWTVGMVFPPG